MWELTDAEIKEKIASFARAPHLVTWSGSAERDVASIPGATTASVLEAILDHLKCCYPVFADYMRNGDLAYIFRCFVGSRRLYIKVKFVFLGGQESMRVFSAHLDR